MNIKTLKYIKNFYRLIKDENNEDSNDFINKINEILSEEVYEYEDLIQNELKNVKDVEKIENYNSSIIHKIIEKLEQKNIVGTIFQKIALIGFISNYMKRKIKVTPENITKKELEDIYNVFKIETKLDLEDHLNGIKKEDILNEIKEIYSYLYNQNEKMFFLQKSKFFQSFINFLNHTKIYKKLEEKEIKRIKQAIKEFKNNYKKDNKIKYFMLKTVFNIDDVDKLLKTLIKNDLEGIENEKIKIFLEKYKNYKLNGPREATEDYQDKISKLATIINEFFWKKHPKLKKEVDEIIKILEEQKLNNNNNHSLLVGDDPNIPF